MKKLFVVILFGILLMGCNKDEPTAPAYTHPFKGTYDVIFAGSYVGAGEVEIGNDGKFSVNVFLVDANQNTSTNLITGLVRTSGQTTGDIYLSGSDIGDITGMFYNKAGSGAYKTIYNTEGTWSMAKQK